MSRTFFFSLGLFLALQGVSLVFVERVTFKTARDILDQQPSVYVSDTARASLRPPDWLSPTMICTGGITLLYSLALPKT